MPQFVYKWYEDQHPGVTFGDYMKMINDAQDAAQNGEPYDITQIGIHGWENDKNNGDGYKQQEYYIVPWYTGTLPSEIDGIPVRSFMDLSINLVGTRHIENVTTIIEGAEASFGTNLNGDKLEL